MIQVTQFSQNYGNPYWPEEANIEMNIRVLVRSDFSHLFKKSLSSPDLDALEWVLFGIVYPCVGYNFDKNRMSGYEAVRAG